MGFFDAILRFLFGGKKAAPPAPASGTTKKGPPPPIPSSVPKPAPPPQVSVPPAAPAPQPPAAPPPPQPPAPAPAQGAGQVVELSTLVAADRTKLGAADVAGAAQRLGVESAAIQAIIQVQSGGQGFAADGRPIILFSPTVFSALTNRRFDPSNPTVSMTTAKSGALGVNQADRWAKLQEAYGLEPEAALQATSWGLFQLAGGNFASAGYPNTSAMVADLAKSEARQLAMFEQYVRGRNLGEALKARNWDAFAQGYGGFSDAAALGKLFSDAYAALKAPAPPPATSPPPTPSVSVPKNYLATLVAKNPAALTAAEIKEAADRMACDVACVKAVLKVESKGRGFSADGRPIILFEPHVFSKQTIRKFDISNPNVSYKSWGQKPYPGTQAGRYAQLEEAFALDPEAAVGAASWGLFQILGLNYKACGFSSATAFVADMSQSEARMLAAFEAFVRANKILDELQKKDWAGFARVYNGPGQVEKYAKLLSDAYAAAGGQA
jgi:hypothetical protein